MRRGTSVKLLPETPRIRQLINLWGDEWKFLRKVGSCRVEVLFEKKYYSEDGELIDSVYLVRNIESTHIE